MLRRMIIAVTAKMPLPESALIPGAEPIFIDQGKTGILFLHGFTGSPYEGRDFAFHFARKGYAVWVPLLPGHGTRPEDLEGIPYQRWLEAAKSHYLEMKKHYPTVIVCGQSMGGALALHLAAGHPVDAVISLAGAIFVKDWRLRLLPLARKVLRYQYKSKGPDIRCKKNKEKMATYHKYPLSSLVQFLNLIEFVRAELPQVTSPTLIVHSRRDHTITYENLDYIYHAISATVKKTLTLEDSYHIISVDQEQRRIFEAVEAFLQEVIKP